LQPKSRPTPKDHVVAFIDHQLRKRFGVAPMQRTKDLQSPLRLHVDDADAPSKVADAVYLLLARQVEAPHLRVTLDGSHLSDKIIAGLVAGLRRLREKGGAIEVTPTSPALRDALAIAGLDRVFAFPIVPRVDPERK
jgi:beta-phosphoglucomutase-like phosphatase (HAD superfamily)